MRIVVIHIRFNQPGPGAIFSQYNSKLTAIRTTRPAEAADDVSQIAVGGKSNSAKRQRGMGARVESRDILAAMHDWTLTSKDKAVFGEKLAQGLRIAIVPGMFVVCENPRQLGWQCDAR